MTLYFTSCFTAFEDALRVSPGLQPCTIPESVLSKFQAVLSNPMLALPPLGERYERTLAAHEKLRPQLF